MGDSIKAIHDDYDDYKYMCQKLGINPVSIYDEFYYHESRILKDHGVSDKYELYKKLDDAKDSDS